MNIFQQLFRRPRQYNIHGAERRNGVKYYYRTEIATGEKEAYSIEPDGNMSSMTYAPPDCKLIDLRRAVTGNGDAWRQSKVINGNT